MIGSVTPRYPRAQRRLVALLVLALAIVALAGCVGNRTAPSQAWSGVAIVGTTGYVGTADGRVLALDLERQGLVTASFEVAEAGRTDAFPGFYGTPVVSDDRVFVGGFDGVVYALETGSLTQRATFEIEGDRLSKGITGGVAVSGDRVVFGAAESADTGRLYVLDTDLRERCVYPSRGADPVGAIWSAPTVVNGIAYFGDLSHNLHAVQVDGCLAVWPQSVDLNGGITASPAVVGNKLYVGTFDQTFYAVDIETGGASALFDADNWFWARAATDGQRVYVPSMDGRLYAMDLLRQTVVWVYPSVDDIGAIVSSPVVVEGFVVVGSDDENLVVLDAATGTRVWDQRVGDKIRAPLVADGTVVYAHGLDRKVHAYDVVERLLLWERDLEAGS